MRAALTAAGVIGAPGIVSVPPAVVGAKRVRAAVRTTVGIAIAPVGAAVVMASGIAMAVRAVVVPCPGAAMAVGPGVPVLGIDVGVQVIGAAKLLLALVPDSLCIGLPPLGVLAQTVGLNPGPLGFSIGPLGVCLRLGGISLAFPCFHGGHLRTLPHFRRLPAVLFLLFVLP